MPGRALRTLLFNAAWLCIGALAWLIVFAFVLMVNILWIFPVLGLVVDLTAGRPLLESALASRGLAISSPDLDSVVVLLTGLVFLSVLGLRLRGRLSGKSLVGLVTVHGRARRGDLAPGRGEVATGRSHAGLAAVGAMTTTAASVKGSTAADRNGAGPRPADALNHTAPEPSRELAVEETHAEVQLQAINWALNGRASGDGRHDAVALLGRGQAAARAGQRSAAYRLFIETLELEPSNEEAWLWRAGTSLHPVEAICCLEIVLALNPGNDRARQGLGEVVWRTLRFRPAQAVDRSAGATRPVRLAAAALVGCVLAAGGRLVYPVLAGSRGRRARARTIS